MKYIITEEGVFEFKDFHKKCINHYGYTDKAGVNVLMTLSEAKEYKIADTIEELCDEFVYEDNKGNHRLCYFGQQFICSNECWLDSYTKDELKEEEIKTIKGAIWTDKGLIYVSSMNNEGELELL